MQICATSWIGSKQPLAVVPAVAPTMSYTTSAGANALISGDIFQPGDKITGSNGSIARIIDGSASGSGGVGGTTQVASFSYLTTKTFTTGTTLTFKDV